MKLNNTIRKQIKDAVIAHGFNERRADLKQRENELGLKVYKSRYTDELLAKMAQLPEWFFTKGKCYDANFAGQHYRFELPESLIRGHDNKRFDFADDHPLTVEFRQFADDTDKLGQEIREAHTQADAILHSVTTTNRLIEVWPEVEPFIPTYSVTKALSVNVGDLNKLVGLP